MQRIERLGRSFAVDDRQPTFWARFEAGTWEPETLEVLDRILSPQSTFIDIGAWIGPTTLWAAFTARRIICLEADPAALEQLDCNLAANPALTRHVEVLPRALHPMPGTVAIGARRKPGDSMSSVLLSGGAQSWHADAITPAELAGRIAPDEDVVFKMDIEGGEYALLPVMAPIIKKTRAALISFHHELAMTAFGWTEEQLEKKETELFDCLDGFQRFPVGDTAMHRATAEWLFLRL